MLAKAAFSVEVAPLEGIVIASEAGEAPTFFRRDGGLARLRQLHNPSRRHCCRSVPTFSECEHGAGPAEDAGVQTGRGSQARRTKGGFSTISYVSDGGSITPGRNDACPCGSGKKYKKCCLDGQQPVNQILPSNYFDVKGKNAEQLVLDLAHKTFLTDWCYPNPVLPSGKELCDLLVVFDDTAIVWQIKDLKLDGNRKYKPSEVEKNLRQLSGARRQLFDLKTQIELQNVRRGKEVFDPESIREVYLISVLLGEGESAYPLVETIKEHTVHVLTRDSTQILLQELDTISDFCAYLREKEKLLSASMHIFIIGGEEELLAEYLLNERSFSHLQNAGYNMITIDAGIWESVQKNPRYFAKKDADRVSYGWDSIIDRAHEAGVPEYELVARELARPNRFKRRVLAESFLDAHVLAHQDRRKDIFRRVLSADDTTYCFLFADDPEPHPRRREMLANLCYVARGTYLRNQKVIGIATEKQIRPTCSYDYCILEIADWTEHEQSQMEKIKAVTGILTSPTIGAISDSEYPLDSSTGKIPR